MTTTATMLSCALMNPRCRSQSVPVATAIDMHESSFMKLVGSSTLHATFRNAHNLDFVIHGPWMCVVLPA